MAFPGPDLLILLLWGFSLDLALKMTNRGFQGSTYFPVLSLPAINFQGLHATAIEVLSKSGCYQSEHFLPAEKSTTKSLSWGVYIDTLYRQKLQNYVSDLSNRYEWNFEFDLQEHVARIVQLSDHPFFQVYSRFGRSVCWVQTISTLSGSRRGHHPWHSTRVIGLWCPKIPLIAVNPLAEWFF